MISSVWSRYGWQASLALVLSMLSLFSITELPALEWLGWLGLIGGYVGMLMLRVGGIKMALPGLYIGFVANVAALFGILVLASRILGAARRRMAEHQGVA
jgi:hypothetical protein